NAGNGVDVVGEATGNAITENSIHDNAGNGVDVVGEATGNSIAENSMHDNGGLAIDLGADGVTENDRGDGDDGPNGLQNYPVLSAVFSKPDKTQIDGTLESKPETTYRLDFYA